MCMLLPLVGTRPVMTLTVIPVRHTPELTLVAVATLAPARTLCMTACVTVRGFTFSECRHGAVLTNILLTEQIRTRLGVVHPRQTLHTRLSTLRQRVTCGPVTITEVPSFGECLRLYVL